MKITFRSPLWFWRLIFIAILALACGFFALASERLNYNWHWQSIPDFFITHDNAIVRTPSDGDVVKITPEGKHHLIEIRPFFGSNFELKTDADHTTVSVHDHVYEGDAVGYEVSWQKGPLLVGLWTTIWLSLLSGIFGILIGIIAALMRLSKNPCLRWLSLWYIEIIRGTPLLVQLMIAYFFIGTLLNLDRNVAGLGALALFSGAYFAEIIRSGLLSISPGIIEAACSLGMTYTQATRFVVMPITLKRTLPSITGQWISLIKDSSLVSVIAMTDLAKAAREVASSTFASFEVWFAVALVYLILTLGLSKITRMLEQRVKFHD